MYKHHSCRYFQIGVKSWSSKYWKTIMYLINRTDWFTLKWNSRKGFLSNDSAETSSQRIIVKMKSLNTWFCYDEVGIENEIW